MEKVLRGDCEEQLAADLSQPSSWEGYSEMPSSFHSDLPSSFHSNLPSSFHSDLPSSFHSDLPSSFRSDPYADESIDFGTRPAHPMDQREARRLVMKRKVLRHRPDGRVEVSEESPSIESDINTNPWNLGHSRTFMDDTISEGEIETRSGNLQDHVYYDDDDWFLEDRPQSHSVVGDFGSDTVSNRPMPRRPPTVASYIAPQAERVRRTDPVAKLNTYRQDWERFSFPGQDSHQSLRWAMRTQMLQSGLPRRAQKRLVPNTYEVPTMKKRDSLRFGVRWDLAHCHMPRRNTFS